MNLWPASATPSKTTISIAEDGTATVRIFEVEDATIALETFSGPGDDGAWPAVVADLMESIHFRKPRRILEDQLWRRRTAMLIDHASLRAGFEVRLRDPWEEALDALSTLQVLGAESAQEP